MSTPDDSVGQQLLDRTGTGPVDPRALVALLMVVSVLVTWMVQAQLLDLRVFYNWDVWFDSDPNVNLDALTQQRSAPQIVFRHPIVGTAGYVAVMTAASAIRWMGLSDGTILEISRWLVLLVMPIAAAWRTWLTFDLVRGLTDERTPPAVLLCLLDMVAFCSLTIGTVPDTFALTGLCMTGMLWLMMNDAMQSRWMLRMSWLTMAVVSIGITISNAVPLLACFVARGVRCRTGLLRAVVGYAALAIIAFSVNSALSLATFGRSAVVDGALVDTQGDLRVPAGPAAWELLWAVSHTFMAPRPAAERSWTSPDQNPEYNLIFSYAPAYRQGATGAWRALLTASLLALGVVGFHASRVHLELATAAGLVFAFNVGIHLFFGEHSWSTRRIGSRLFS